MNQEEESNPSFSAVKRNVRLGSCPVGNDFIKYPLDASPMSWMSCHDAYSYTWESDADGELVGMDKIDILKLSRSMGFCPQSRCQLENVFNSPSPGFCPKNLCYTKVENGRPSFGACCYDADGLFESGDVIGVHYKSQPQPKPIYAHSRVKLRKYTEDGFPKDFVNANMVYPGLILSQCPLSVAYSDNNADHKGSFQSTIEDTLIMIVEQNITHFVQLAPISPSRALIKSVKSDEVSKYDMCRAFPFDFVDDESKAITQKGVSNFSYRISEDGHFYTAFFDVSAAVTTDVDGRRRVMYFVENTHNSQCDASFLCNETIVSVKVEYHWIMNWVDFEPPLYEAIEAINYASNRSVAHMQAGGTVAVTCLSGRGRYYSVRCSLLIVSLCYVLCRSGTFASIVLGKLNQIRMMSELVDIIVGMREHRDGLVELPSQLRFVSQLLLLGDPAICDWNCRLRKNILTKNSYLTYSAKHICPGINLRWFRSQFTELLGAPAFVIPNPSCGSFCVAFPAFISILLILLVLTKYRGAICNLGDHRKKNLAGLICVCLLILPTLCCIAVALLVLLHISPH